MRIYIYNGGEQVVGKSGVGQAIRHQRDCLTRCGVPVTEHWTRDTAAIHINTVLPDSVLAALGARLRGKKVVWYGHSTMEDFRQSFRGSDQLSGLFRRWIRFCYNCGNVVVTPTEYSRRLLESYGVRRPIYVLSNGVDTDFFRPMPEARQAFRSRYGLTEQDKAVISVGHMIARKGLPEFLELARSMPQVRFFWFGYTAPELVPAIIREALANAPENVTFPGYVSREELREAYCGCDVFAFLSHEETEGIVVLEALACGIPTVVRDIPVYHSWLKHGENIYKSSNLDEFQQIVMGLLDHSLPDLTPAGRKVAEARSLEAVGERLREIYQKEQILPASRPSLPKRHVGAL